MMYSCTHTSCCAEEIDWKESETSFISLAEVANIVKMFRCFFLLFWYILDGIHFEKLKVVM